jgi:transcriptional regulator with XRE-family HTH domain
VGSLPFCHLTFRGKIERAGYPKTVKTVGDAIRKRPMDLGLRQLDVARIIGCNEMTVVNWELGHTAPSIRQITKVIAFLGFDPLGSGGTMAEKLVNHRKRLGITQKELALNLAIDPSTLARWERGERRPTGRFLEKVQAIGI